MLLLGMLKQGHAVYDLALVLHRCNKGRARTQTLRRPALILFSFSSHLSFFLSDHHLSIRSRPAQQPRSPDPYFRCLCPSIWTLYHYYSSNCPISIGSQMRVEMRLHCED